MSNGRYKSCLHHAVVHREKERRSLAYFLAPREDCVVRPPPAPAPRLYPDFTWAELMRFTQRHYRVDACTLDAFARWLDPSSCSATPLSHVPGVACVPWALLTPCVTCPLCSLRAKRVVACRGGSCQRGGRPVRHTGLQLWGARYVFGKMPRR